MRKPHACIHLHTDLPRLESQALCKKNSFIFYSFNKKFNSINKDQIIENILMNKKK